MEEGTYNYWVIWAVYLIAAALFYRIYWRLTGFRRRLWLSYSLRALMAALILTPWYANTQGDSLAPALMVTTLDAITVGVDAASRALVPLLVALLLAEIVASILWLGRKKRKKAAKP
jgi:hypothetical protein